MSDVEVDTKQKRDRVKVNVTVDTGWIAVLLLFISALAWGLGTMPGNRFMCQEKWAPVYIDCLKVPADAR